jgi:glycine/D-amino acid oxidase-like deaminating enzyme
VTDKRLHELVSDFGKESAEAFWEAGFAAIDQVAAIIRNEKPKCDFKWVPDYLHASLKGDAKKEREGLEKDAQLAQELGFEAEFLNSIPYFNRPGVRFPNQAKFHPIKYLSALARTIRQRELYLRRDCRRNLRRQAFDGPRRRPQDTLRLCLSGHSHTPHGHDEFGFGNPIPNEVVSLHELCVGCQAFDERSWIKVELTPST